MAKCEHKNFKSVTKVGRITNDAGLVYRYVAEIEIHCADCMTPFQFMGVPNGLSKYYPTVNIEATELRAPINPVKL